MNSLKKLINGMTSYRWTPAFLKRTSGAGNLLNKSLSNLDDVMVGIGEDLNTKLTVQGLEKYINAVNEFSKKLDELYTQTEKEHAELPDEIQGAMKKKMISNPDK